MLDENGRSVPRSRIKLIDRDSYWPGRNPVGHYDESARACLCARGHIEVSRDSGPACRHSHGAMSMSAGIKDVTSSGVGDPDQGIVSRRF